MVPEYCVCHASLDVVCDVSEYGMWYVLVCVGGFYVMGICGESRDVYAVFGL